MQRNKIKKKERLEVPYKKFLEEEVDDEEILSKFLSSQPYNKKNVKKVSKFLMNRSKFKSKEQFRIFESIGAFVKNFDVPEEKQEFLFIVYPKLINLWVVFCIIWEENEGGTILYKDSSGATVPREIERKLRTLISQVQFIVCQDQDQEEDEEFLYGPLCLRNLEMLLEFLEKDPLIVKGFLEIPFCKAADINQQKLDAVISLTHDLSKNADFKAYLKKFVEKLPRQLASDVEHLHKILKEELEKDEKDVNLDRIEKARQRCLIEKNIKQFSEDFKVQMNEKAQEYELEGAKNFTKEMKRMRQIFQILNTCKGDENKFQNALGTINELLDINQEEIKSFGQHVVENEETEQEDILILEDITYFVKNIAENDQSNEEMQPPGCTPIEELWTQINFHVNEEDHLQDSNLHLLQEKFYKVETNYEKWKNADLKAINKWAKRKKGKLGTNDDAICEALAVTDRAFKLLKNGRRLRCTQILAVLIFFTDQKNQGQLCQIQTGEGKTLIVSLLAVIKVLQGLTVDVITSSPVLAQEAVNETKTFYTTFGLTVANNNYGQSKNCYTADVCYGSISSFQFDYLIDTFEGTTMRHGRGFGQVILDEVDSMLIDNGGHIAKLASPYPGMENLKYIYIKIWQELHKAEKSYFEEVEAKILNMNQSSGDFMLQESNFEMENYITEKIKESDPTSIFLIPFYLKDYAKSKLHILIRNALHAKYHCHEHQQYRLIVNDEGERVIAPVDYLNTGVTMNNTVWSNGLHQFVQLKHNLHLTSESLTSSFISNIGYIKKYEDKNIFGMTGTLGSRAEQELISKIYNVNYTRIPTYKKKIFEEYRMLIVEDDEWVDRVVVETLKKINNERAVLVICETEEDLLSLNEKLLTIQKTARVYANEDNAKEPEAPVKVGDIILATNIAGRGTDFRTEENLESKGGLHVCVGFLPCNLRVEEQAFGRTSRQGNNGSAQLIVRESEVVQLNLEEVYPDDDEIKGMRDLCESGRLEEIKNVLVKELMFKDQLFNVFLKFYGEERRKKRKKQEKFVLDDLKEFWAFWLEKKDFKAEDIENTSIQSEFDNFCEDAKDIIEGRISHNPYYCLALAEYHLRNDDRKDAFQVLQRAIEMSEDNNLNLLTGAYLKLFHIAIADGGQIKYRIKKAIGELFFISVKENVKYKTEALEHLEKAAQALDKEINYINECLKSEDNNFCTEETAKGNEQQNLFVKHMCSRLSCLNLHKGNIDTLIEQIRQMSAVALEGKASTKEEQFQQVYSNSQLQKIITKHELHEVQSIGIDTLFCLREVHDVPVYVIRTAQVQIVAGIAALTVGLVFLPSFPVMSQIAATLISEGLLDIIFEVLSQGHSEFNKKSFHKSKFISYGISILTFGLSAVLQSKMVLDKAIEYCQRLSKFLRESTRFKKICESLAKVVDKIQKYFEKLRLAAELKNLQALEKLGKLKVTRWNLFFDFAKMTAMKIYKNPALYNSVVVPIESQVFEKLFDAIFKELRNAVESNDNLKLKLRTSEKTDIDSAVDQILNKSQFKTVVETIHSKLSLNLKVVPLAQLLSSVAELSSLQMFLNYANTFASDLEKLLDFGKANNNVDEVIEEVCRKMAVKMIASLKECYNNAKKIVNFARRIAYKKELIIRDVVISTGENFLFDQIYSKIIDKLRTEMKKALEDSIRTRPNLMEKLQTTEPATIFSEVDKFQRDHGIAQFRIAFEVLKSLEVVPIGRIASSGFSVTICSYKFIKCSSKFAAHLEEVLKGGDSANNVNDLVEGICTKMIDFLLPLLERVITGTVDIISAARNINEFVIEDLIKNLPTIGANMVNVLMYEFRGKFFQLITKLLVSGCKKLASLMEKLRTTPLDEINSKVNEILGRDTVKILQLFYELYATLESVSKTKLLSGRLETIFNLSGVSLYIGQFALSLEKSLQGGNENNNTEEIVEDICSKLMKSVEPLLEQLFFQRNNPNFASDTTADKFSRVINLVWNLLQPKLIEAFKRDLRRSIRRLPMLMDKLRTTYQNSIRKALDDTLRRSLIERLLTKLVPEVLVSLRREFGKSGVTLLTLSFDITVHLNKLRIYQDNFAEALEKALRDGAHDNDVESIIDEIEHKMVEIVTPLLEKVFENTKNIIGVVQEDNFTDFEDTPIDTKKITTILITEIEESVTNELVKVLDKSLRKKFDGNSSLKEKLCTNSSDQVIITVNILLNVEEKGLVFFQELCQTLQTGTHDFQMLFAAIRAGLDLSKFVSYMNKFVSDLEEHLALGHDKSYLEDTIDDVCMTMTKFIQPLIKEFLSNSSNFARQENKSLKTLPEVLDITKQFVWRKISNQILEEFKNRLDTSIRERESLMTKLQTTNRKFIVDSVRKILKKGLIERLFTKLVPQFLTLFEEELDKSVVVLVSSSFTLTVDMNNIFNYCNHFAAQLDYALKGGTHHNNADNMIIEIKFNLVTKVSPLLENIYQQLAHFKSALFGKVDDFTDIAATLNATTDIVIQEICASIIDQMVKTTIQTLKQSLNLHPTLENKLRTSTVEDVNSKVAEILMDDGIRKIVRDLVDEILQKFDSGLDESAVNFLSQGVANLANLVPLIYEFASKLEQRLLCGEESNDIDEMIEEICLDVGVAVHDCLKEVYDNMANVVGNMEEVKKQKKIFMEELKKQLSCLKTKLKSYL